MITTIVKRDGREVPFNLEKITNAIYKSQQAVGNGDSKLAFALAIKVAEQTDQAHLDTKSHPSVEEIQDIVEQVLIDADLTCIVPSALGRAK